MQTVLQLLKLWRMYAWLDWLWVTRSFRFFFMYYVGDTIITLAALLGMVLLAENFEGIGAWTKGQVVFMLGYGAMVDGLLYIGFGYNVLHIGRRLGRGQFDHTLIQPQPIWMALLTDGFNPFGASGIFVSGLGLLLWALSHLTLNISPMWVVLLIVNLVASAVVVLSFAYFWGSLAFWAPRAAEEINTPSLHMLGQLKLFPLDGLSGFALSSLLTVAPVGFVAWYPSRALLGIDATLFASFVTPVAALALGALAIVTFQRGMTHYRRVGSQRYRAMGHRS